MQQEAYIAAQGCRTALHSLVLGGCWGSEWEERVGREVGVKLISSLVSHSFIALTTEYVCHNSFCARINLELMRTI